MQDALGTARTGGTWTRFKAQPLSNTWLFIRRWPIIPIAILVLLVLTAAFAPWIAPHGEQQSDLRATRAPPSFLNPEWYAERPNVENRYLFGTDHVGRDILSRMIYGARISLMVATISLAGGIIVGSAVGLAAGYYGGLIDEIAMRAVDAWLALPFLMIALIVAVTIGQSLTTVMGLLALIAWSGGVRNVRAEVLSLRERDYVLVARIAGASSLRIMIRHLVPGVFNTIVVLATLRVGGLILAEASLSFLGAGIPLPTPTWGNMVSEGRSFLNDAWWIAFFPGLAIFLVVMSLNFLGDWLRDRLDPRLRQLN
ncbi:MAG: ABC transporter permease [Dehalococcoidia bacterium]